MPGRTRFTLTDSVLCKQLARSAWILTGNLCLLSECCSQPIDCATKCTDPSQLWCRGCLQARS